MTILSHTRNQIPLGLLQKKPKLMFAQDSPGLAGCLAPGLSAQLCHATQQLEKSDRASNSVSAGARTWQFLGRSGEQSYLTGLIHVARSHKIPPYNTLMSQDQKRNTSQMQIAYFKTLFHLSWYTKYCLSNKNALQQPNKTSCAPDLDETLHARHHVSPTLLTDSYSSEVDLARDV